MPQQATSSVPCTETIMVIEDDEWVRRIASRALRARGYTVLEACDGPTALALAGEFPGVIHLVLSDAIMPGMTGGAAVDLLQVARPDIRAVFMSGYPSGAVERRGVDHTQVVVVAKPFSHHELLRCIREQLDLPRPAANEAPPESDAFERIADPARLAVVRATELLDAPRDEMFDRLTRLATQLLGAPSAFISIVDEDRDFYLSAHGVREPFATEREVRGRTFCHYTMRSVDALVSADTRADVRFRGVPTVECLGAAAFVGVPLIIDGQPIGAMCVIDVVPHHWSAPQVRALTDLAAVALDAIALQAATRRHAAARAALHSANLQMLLAKNSAELSNRAKAEFLTHMSHELRTPLNSIIGFTNILARNASGTIGPREMKYIERVSFNGGHLLALVERILDLSKIEQGELQLRCTWVNVEHTVRTLCDSLADQAATAGVSLTVDIMCDGHSDAVPHRPLHTDEGKLHRILLNLLGNALKFTPSGGAVRVALYCDPSSGEPRHLDVIDTGIGIAPAAQARVFEAFEQAEDDTGARFGGTGLGLRISRALCESLGFGLTLTSELGQGTTLSIRFA